MTTPERPGGHRHLNPRGSWDYGRSGHAERRITADIPEDEVDGNPIDTRPGHAPRKDQP